jgi:hypothetical protein
MEEADVLSGYGLYFIAQSAGPVLGHSHFSGDG